MTGIPARRVAPFGHLGITACVPLPRASRSLPRPSSPPTAQASPTCLPSLDYIIGSKQNYAHYRTSDVFLRKSHLNLDSFKSHDLPDFRCQTAPTRKARGQGVDNREWNGRNVSKRSDLREPFGRRGDGVLGSVKEVIQPQVPLRLPCYDFAPVTALAFGRLVPCGFRHGLRALTASMA